MSCLQKSGKTRSNFYLTGRRSHKEIVKQITGNFFYFVVGKVDDFQVFVLIPKAENVPIQKGDFVSNENQNLGVGW